MLTVTFDFINSYSFFVEPKFKKEDEILHMIRDNGVWSRTSGFTIDIMFRDGNGTGSATPP